MLSLPPRRPWAGGGPMRRDPRFALFTEALGLNRYWRQAGVKPDYQVAAEP